MSREIAAAVRGSRHSHRTAWRDRSAQNSPGHNSPRHRGTGAVRAYSRHLDLKAGAGQARSGLNRRGTCRARGRKESRLRPTVAMGAKVLRGLGMCPSSYKPPSHHRISLQCKSQTRFADMAERFLTFRDLREAGIVKNWQTLKGLVERGNSRLKKLGSRRLWAETEIANHMASLPIAGRRNDGGDDAAPC